jgi:hypothetical protein
VGREIATCDKVEGGERSEGVFDKQLPKPVVVVG